MALPKHETALVLRGHTDPRIAPPIPAKSQIREFEAAAKVLGIKLMPWQKLAARYMTAKTGKRWTFPEFCAVVARQNGKTTLLLPRILMALQAGQTVLHTAQNRAIPRETFEELVRRIRDIDGLDYIRWANGQETIRFKNGGRYILVAPRHGVRGYHADIVILDETREQVNNDLKAAMLPTLMTSPDPQTIYLSNAGDDESVVLNDLRRRMETDPALAYLEWSAGPDRALDDREGWAEANPALGWMPEFENNLEAAMRSLPAGQFETEHLCRWVISMMPRIVTDLDWLRCRGPVGVSLRPSFAFSMDPSGTRASAAIAWPQADGTFGLRVVADVTGDPIDVNRLGPDLKQVALRLGATATGFDSRTDADLARYFPKAKPLIGKDFAAASGKFRELVKSGVLRWDDADAVTGDLMWTAQKPYEAGAWQAVKAKEERPVTAAFAAIRAVWLASGPKPSVPKVWC